MATATRVPAKPAIDTRDVQLTLTHEEATTLVRLIGWHVTGDRSGPRADLASIYNALRPVGVRGDSPLKVVGALTALFIKKD